jgi:nucleoid-associated protein YgaU
MKARPERHLGSDAALATTILLLGVFLAVTGGTLIERTRGSAARHQSLSFEDLMGFLATASGLVVVTWWILSLAAALVAAALERTGNRKAGAAAGRFSPAFMRRLALAAVGMQLIGAPVVHAAPMPNDPVWRPTSVAVRSTAWAPTPEPRPGAGTVTNPQWQPSAPLVDPGPLSGRPVRTALHGPDPEAGSVTVMAGDSLWSIAARHLGPSATGVDIAMEWPRWFESNRVIIGGNPNVLLPGQVLHPPATD